ncbi:hypothetical protein AZE42_09545 [Rhizopogon vesiculosus]|uniref:Uncharacterized protein n=1 Tax=Rhizopogon vesiculosus TaxID=180088 RepID=A0A1J8QBL0_9AGAM|nr:hypothetical protein AZE42_09545 [Rhizopogon vesiculosus]
MRARHSSRVRDDSDDSKDKKDAQQEVRTKTIRFNSQSPSPKSVIDEVKELGRKMHTLDIRNVAYSGCYICLACLAPTVAQMYPHPLQSGEHATLLASAAPFPSAPSYSQTYRDSSCFFCGLPHLIHNCAAAEEYIRISCIINNNNYILFLDHSRIHWSPNGTIKQAVDDHYGSAHIPSSPATGANLTTPTVDRTRRDSPPHMPATTTSNALISETYFLQCAPIVENHAVVVVIEEEDEEPQDAKVFAITHSKSKAVKSVSTVPPPRSREETLPQAAAESKKTPAFTYESKAASPDAMQHVYQEILNIVVPSVTVADLLAISTDLHKEAVEHCQAHCIPAPSVLSAHVGTTDTAPIPPQVEHAMPL